MKTKKTQPGPESLDPVESFRVVEKELLREGASASVAALHAAALTAWSMGLRSLESEEAGFEDVGLALGLLNRAAESLQPPDDLVEDMGGFVLAVDVVVGGKSIVEICADRYRDRFPARAVAALEALSRPVDRIEKVPDEAIKQARGDGPAPGADETLGAVVRWFELDGEKISSVAIPVPLTGRNAAAEAEAALREVHEELCSEGVPLRRSPGALAFAAFMALGASMEDDEDDGDDEDFDDEDDLEADLDAEQEADDVVPEVETPKPPPKGKAKPGKPKP